MNFEKFTTQTLWDDGCFILSRVTTRGGARIRLTTKVSGDQAAADAEALLEHSYGLRTLLDRHHFARPESLSKEDGRMALYLEDPGGVVLSSIATRLLPLGKVLSIAANVAAALNALHARGLVHNDVRPEHVLVDEQTEAVAMTGFGLTSIASTDDLDNVPSALLMDVLPYMSPERTGLVNRRADCRSDLYSLGILLYRMLTGEFPYLARSAREWLHCHIAKEPISLDEYHLDVPEPVAAIINRLLSKATEDRYQTARGLEHDLRLCADRWRQDGRIAPFPLGAADAPDRLLIPERLYGREREVQTLISAFERVAKTGSTEFVLVSGYAGIGKSTLVEELHWTMHRSGGRFASGKFDQYKRDIPYTTIAQCLETLVRQILSASPADLEGWRIRIREALGVHGQLVLNLIPELARIVGQQPPVPELPPQEAQTRFVGVLSRFVGAFASPGQPLVLFLDDLQWLDAGTISVLESLAKTSDIRYVMLIGAFRDNEVGPAHPMTQVIEKIRASHVGVHEIVLAPLSLTEVARLVRDALHADTVHSRQLAQFVFEKTGGNPFFVVQFLRVLADECYIAFDHQRREWVWNVEQIEKRGFPDSVVDLMVGKIGRLSDSTRKALAKFACLGANASAAVLARVSDQPQEAVHAALADAVEQGLVYRRTDGYAFAHDRIQEAAYALVTNDERAHLHLHIGRRLDGDDDDPDVEGNIFELVNQYNRAIAVLEDARERERVAKLDLRAGRCARASSAYGSALAYAAVGSSLLGDNAWHTHYGEKFALELLRAECEFLTGNSRAADDRLRDIAVHVNSLPDRASVTFLRVTLHTALDEVQVAVDICLEYLRHIGIDWVAHPGREQAEAEYQRLLERIGQRPVKSLIDLPFLDDEALEATLNVLIAVLPPAFFSDENLVCLVLCRIANLSVAHGNSDASSLGFAYLGMVAGPLFGDYQAGFEFGSLGLALVDDKGLERFKARVYMCVAYHVMPWTQPMHAGIPLLRRSFAVAKERGDLTYIGFSSCCLVTSLLASGHPLDQTEEEAVERLRIVREAGFGLIVDIITAQLEVIRGLRGLAPWLGSSGEEYADRATFEQHLESNPALAIAECWYWIRQLQGQYLAGDIAGALTAAGKASPLLWTSAGHFELAEYHFFAALTRLRHDEVTGDERAANVAFLAEHVDKLRIWSQHCPANFASRVALVDAEIARTQGREFDAMREYERAIRHARENRLPHIEGLANEVAGRFYMDRGFAAIGFVYLRNARLAYTNWGAAAKIRSLDACYPELAAGSAAVMPNEAVGDRLQMETVVKASQAISGERVLERLMHTLMSIVLEHAGARRALLILPDGERVCVEAEAAAIREGSQVKVGRRVASSQMLPLSMLHHSFRTRELLLIDDASSANPFSVDEYFVGRDSRSVLCLPLVKQTRVIGALYLENELAPGVFTPSRTAVLKLLASQAAISIENASLEEVEALLEEKDALLHEVHHRVKNNLQLISSLLSLQAARVADRSMAELFTDSRNRVRSMAMVHENLYRAGNFARIDMAGHVRNLCGHLARVYELSKLNITLDVVVDDVQLDMNRAVSCGLIINELVSNALKHAFPDGRRGRLRVELALRDDRACRLSVSDDGVGLSTDFSFKHADSLGLQLVSDLAHQLHASIQLDRSAGTNFNIHFQL
ncbi:AAA family ATPase [Paraburkholderia sp. LEh10]|nr:AAA family ATPase [Paraburkholderia sp. LEh10]